MAVYKARINGLLLPGDRFSLYRVVVADSRSPRDGKFIEEIGTYDPNQDPSVFKFDEESAKKWLANGAKPTETVGKLLKEAGIME